MFDVAVDGPLAHVKRFLKVSPSGPCERTDSPIDDRDKSGGSEVSISSCFGRIADLRGRGFEESGVRALTSTVYIGEMIHP